jgi:peptide/nickel transport system substrate-binding protein
MTANRHWWGGTPSLDKIVVTKFSDSSAAIAALQSGSVQMLEDFDPLRAKGLKSAGFAIASAGQTSTMEMRINTAKAPFDQPAYRHVLNYAIDRQGIINTVLGGYGRPALTPWYVVDPAGDKKPEATYKYDISRTQNALKQDKITNPNFTLMINSGQPYSIAAGQIIQASLAGIGVKVDIQQFDSATYVSRVISGDFEAAMATEEGNELFPTLLSLNSNWRTASSNPLWGGHVPPSYVAAIKAGQTALTTAALAAAVKRLENVDLSIMNSTLIIGSRPPVFATSKKVHGLRFSLDAAPLYQNIRIG